MNPNTYYNCQNELLIYARERLWSALDQGAREREEAMSDPASYRETLRAKLITLLGLESAELNDRPQPLVETSGEILDQGLVIEKILLTPVDGQCITALVYRRADLPAAPGVLFLCGHDHKGKAAPEYQIACRLLARSGFVVLTIDPPGQGERLAFPDGAPAGEDPRWFTPGTTEHTLLGLPAFFRGVSSAGYFMSEALSALTYLASRSDVLSDQLAVTGNSGGGLQSALLGAICPDVRAVATGTFISSRRTIFDSGVPQDAEQCLPAIDGRAWDHSDLLLLIAPRACLVLAAEDDFFPLTGCRRTVNESKAFWPATAGPALELFIDEGGHRYSEAMARRTIDFFSTVFSMETELAGLAEMPLPVEMINCSSSGQILLDRPEQQTWLSFERIARRKLREKRVKAPASPQSMNDWLRAKVFRGRSAHTTIDFVSHYKEEIELDGIGPLKLRYVLWESTEGIHNYGLHVIRSSDQSPNKGAGRLFEAKHPLLYKLVQDMNRFDDSDVRQALIQGSQVFFHVPTAAGPIAPLPLGGRDPEGLFGARNRLTMDLIAAGDSLAAIRIYDCRSLLMAISRQLQDEDQPSNLVLSADPAYRFYIKLAKRLGAPGEPDEDASEPLTIEELLPPRLYQPKYMPEVLVPGILNWLEPDECNE